MKEFLVVLVWVAVIAIAAALVVMIVLEIIGYPFDRTEDAGVDILMWYED